MTKSSIFEINHPPRGVISPTFEPVLTVPSGSVVQCATPDAGWGHWWQGTDTRKGVQKYDKPDPELDTGPALLGPVAIKGLEPGEALLIDFLELRPATWGFTAAGGWSSETNDFLRLNQPELHHFHRWRIHPDAGWAEDENGIRIPLRPFLGTIGMPQAEPAFQNAIHPRRTGGNLDCPDLVRGTRLVLPVEVPGGKLVLGDGHACQGFGEVSGTALECPMERVRLQVHRISRPRFDFPFALTPRGWITFGFDPDLDQAALRALDTMTHLIAVCYAQPRNQVLTWASLLVHLEILQIVNGVKAVQARFDPHLWSAPLQRHPLPGMPAFGSTDTAVLTPNPQD